MTRKIQFILPVVLTLLVSCNSGTGKKEKAGLPETTARTKPVLQTEEALKFCEENDMNTDFCILVDMSVHSGKERLVVWDFKKKKIRRSALVSHGCGNRVWSWDKTKTAPQFSNTPGSHLSSLGKYAIAQRGWSNWGIHVKYWLDGLESSNSNARKRIIVLHGWEKIPDTEVYPKGTPEGWGCPAVSNDMMRYLDKKLKNAKKPVLFWIYH